MNTNNTTENTTNNNAAETKALPAPEKKGLCGRTWDWVKKNPLKTAVGVGVVVGVGAAYIMNRDGIQTSTDTGTDTVGDAIEAALEQLK